MVPKSSLAYILVAPCVPLKRGGRETYTYYAEENADLVIGAVVRIPFGKRSLEGVVLQTGLKRPNYPTKPISSFRNIVLTPQQITYASWMSSVAKGGIGYTLRLFIP